MAAKKDQTPASDVAAEEKTRSLTFGTKVGRALEKLLEINTTEATELAEYPANIKARAAKRRAELLAGLEEPVKKAVLAAATTQVDEAPAEKSQAAE